VVDLLDFDHALACLQHRGAGRPAIADRGVDANALAAAKAFFPSSAPRVIIEEGRFHSPSS